MPKYNCCVPNCTNNWRNSPELKFHTIPKDVKVRKEYKRLIRNDSLKEDSVNTRICGAHFPDGERMSRTQLPTIFPWSTNTKKRREIVKHQLETTKKKKIDFIDVNSSLCDTSVGQVVDDHVDSVVNQSQNDSLTETQTEIEIMENGENDGRKDSMEELLQMVEKLKNQVASLTNELHEQKTKPKFDIDQYKGNDDDVSFFVGFANYEIMVFCFNLLKDQAHKLNYGGKVNDDPNRLRKPGPKRKLSLWQEFTLVCMKLRLGLFEKDLAERFRISVSTVSDIYRTWVKFMRVELEPICINWPSKDQLFEYMPPVFKTMYPRLVSIIDCTELQMESPSSLDKKSLCYSSYKSRTTLKSLIGITPSGVVSFCSDLYCGSISDPEIVKRSGFLEYLERGDYVMADKGFTIRDELAEVGACLVMPHFLSKDKKQFSKEEVIHNKKVASLRIHVERYMERLKNWHYFDRPTPISQSDIVSDIWIIIACLSNFLPPMID